MQTLYFESKLQVINGWLILKLPNKVSEALPSRGMVMGILEMGPKKVLVPIEPDGQKGHWIHITSDLMPENEVQVKKPISMGLTPTKDWEDPLLPKDLEEALIENKLIVKWNTITTKARWEWIRWLRFTNNPDTRKKRISTACDMLSSGKKRPCCFDQSRSTVMEVSKGGILDFQSDKA